MKKFSCSKIWFLLVSVFRYICVCNSEKVLLGYNGAVGATDGFGASSLMMCIAPRALNSYVPTERERMKVVKFGFLFSGSSQTEVNLKIGIYSSTGMLDSVKERVWQYYTPIHVSTEPEFEYEFNIEAETIVDFFPDRHYFICFVGKGSVTVRLRSSSSGLFRVFKTTTGDYGNDWTKLMPKNVSLPGMSVASRSLHFWIELEKTPSCNGIFSDENEVCNYRGSCVANETCQCVHYNLNDNDYCGSCSKQNYDFETNCTLCLGNYNVLEDCQACLRGYDVGSGCQNCLSTFKKNDKNECERKSTLRFGSATATTQIVFGSVSSISILFNVILLFSLLIISCILSFKCFLNCRKRSKISDVEGNELDENNNNSKVEKKEEEKKKTIIKKGEKKKVKRRKTVINKKSPQKQKKKGKLSKRRIGL